MSINDFCYFCIDGSMQKIEIFDNEKGKVVFKGTLSEEEIPDSLLYEEVTSFDPIENNVLCLNIH